MELSVYISPISHCAVVKLHIVGLFFKLCYHLHLVSLKMQSILVLAARTEENKNHQQCFFNKKKSLFK